MPAIQMQGVISDFKNGTLVKLTKVSTKTRAKTSVGVFAKGPVDTYRFQIGLNLSVCCVSTKELLATGPVLRVIRTEKDGLDFIIETKTDTYFLQIL